MVEGGSSPERLKARLAAAQNQSWFAAMVERLIGESVDYLEAQVKAGAEAVQIFDSWAGDLSWDLQERWVYEPLRKLVEGFRTRCPGIPVIVFARGVGAGHSAVAETVKPNALSLEPGVPLDWAGRVLSPLVSLQGNLDPVALVAGGDVLSRAVNKIVKALPAQKHIFNLGHGVRPETSPGHVEELVRLVRKADD
jgi:uroporphyrinogen decarboxylase